jgi:hypothetical protein
LKDAKGNILVVFTKYDDINIPIVPPSSFFFNGIYLLNIAPSNIIFTFDESQVSFKGCNYVSSKYTAATDGSIKFTRGISTLIGCLIDNDSVYIKALENAVNYFYD